MADIILRNVAKSYARTKVIHDLSLTINSGEFVVILGPSGCGKSTLLRMIAGLESITGGEVSIDDIMVNKLEPRERGCAMVFQNYALYPHMTVAENIGYALRVAGVAKSERQSRISKVAETLGLTEFLNRKPGQLSGGQRQRVAMGRAMIREPKVFLYDEPLSNLDARLRVAMRVEIRKLHQRLGTTSLFVTHDQVEALTLADRIVVMNKGHIEQVGTPLEIYEQPASTYVAGFIGTPGLNLLEGVAAPVDGCVILADGQRLAYDRSRWPDVVAGPIIAGFRAESVKFGQSGLTCQFEFAEEHGAVRHAHLRMSNEIVIAHVPGPLKLAQGSEARIHVPAEMVQLFDKSSGKRLAPERHLISVRDPVMEVA